MDEARCFAIVPAAGMGKRMQAGMNKQYLLLDGVPIVARTLQVFQQSKLVDGIILVTPQPEITFCRQEIVEKYALDKVIAIVPGGKERQHSVFNGLQELLKYASATDVVMIHDGVRPFIDEKLIKQMYSNVKEHGAALVAVPVKDTIKTVANGFVVATPDRSTLWQAQTPQAFRFGMILDAHKKADADGFLGTDDCALYERAGGKIAIVTGDYSNIKITTPEDLPIAERLLSLSNL
ncbi:MAG: 2-C-methyl-D-erythritol 4-phosphate cytidylyltransferase [Trichlorobacter sp.]|nr:2-C-methyl-D-erythritol 4-phosphate cytidylyltransferase [Trichlorobacter sp.]